MVESLEDILFVEVFFLLSSLEVVVGCTVLNALSDQLLVFFVVFSVHCSDLDSGDNTPEESEQCASKNVKWSD